MKKIFKRIIITIVIIVGLFFLQTNRWFQELELNTISVILDSSYHHWDKDTKNCINIK